MIEPYSLLTLGADEWVVGEFAERLRELDRVATGLLRQIRAAYVGEPEGTPGLASRRNPKGQQRSYPINPAGRRVLYGYTKGWRVWRKHFRSRFCKAHRDIVATARATGYVKDNRWYRLDYLPQLEADRKRLRPRRQMEQVEAEG